MLPTQGASPTVTIGPASQPFSVAASEVGRASPRRWRSLGSRGAADWLTGHGGPPVGCSAVPTLERLNTAALRDMVRTFRDAVRAHAPALNRLNVYPVPDGDTGTNMARTLDAVVDEMDGVDAADLAATCEAISHGSLMGARGNSGVILSQILRGFASTVKAQGAPVWTTTLAAPASPRRSRPRHGRLSGGAEADRGNDPHRRARERRRRHGGRRRGCVARRRHPRRPATPASGALDQHARAAAGVEGGRRRRRGRRRVPAAARRGAARRRRRSAPRSRRA